METEGTIVEKLVFISSPYAGNVEANTAFAKAACLFAVKQGVVPIAVHLMYPQILDDRIPTEREKLDNTMFQLENAKQEIQKEFPKEQELKEKLEKLDTINAELKINDNDHEMLGDEQEEKEDKISDKKSPERC